MRKVSIEKIINILNKCIEGANITTEQVNDSLLILGMDSISFIKTIVSIEEEFDCEIPDSKLVVAEMDTVEKIYAILCSLYDEVSEMSKC